MTEHSTHPRWLFLVLVCDQYGAQSKGKPCLEHGSTEFVAKAIKLSLHVFVYREHALTRMQRYSKLLSAGAREYCALFPHSSASQQTNTLGVNMTYTIQCEQRMRTSGVWDMPKARDPPELRYVLYFIRDSTRKNQTVYRGRRTFLSIRISKHAEEILLITFMDTRITYSRWRFFGSLLFFQ